MLTQTASSCANQRDGLSCQKGDRLTDTLYTVETSVFCWHRYAKSVVLASRESFGSLVCGLLQDGLL
jgi:hypothetical protein